MNSAFRYATLGLFLILVNSAGSFAQKIKVPQIDATLIKTDSLLWDLHALSKAPVVKWLDKTSRVHSLLYQGTDYEGHSTQVFAYYSNPDILNGRKSGKTKFPGVVLIHGGGGQAFKEWAEKWASEGYAAIAMDLSGNDADQKKLANGGADQSNENKFEKIEQSSLKDVWSYQAVAASILAHSLLLSFPEVEKEKTCVTGISWGGYLTCIVGALDNRFKAAAPVYGCGYYDESDVFSVPLNRLSPAGRQRWMRFFDPSAYLSFAQPKFLFVNGNKDKHYNVVPYDKTYRLIPENKRTVLLLPEMRHSHPHGWQPHEIRYFFENVLFGKSPLANVENVTIGAEKITAKLNGPVSVWTADFYYSNDVTSDNESRKWSKQRATVDSKSGTLSTAIPKEGFKYGFFHVLDHRNLSGSSTFMIR
jgi:dienelactone hydrolase